MLNACIYWTIATILKATSSIRQAEIKHSHVKHMVTHFEWKRARKSADRKLRNFTTNTYVCIIYYFHSFFPIRSIQMKRDNFSLFDSDTESIQAQWKKEYSQRSDWTNQKSLVCIRICFWTIVMAWEVMRKWSHVIESLRIETKKK